MGNNKYIYHEKTFCRIFWNILARIWGLWKCCFRRRFPRVRDCISRGCTCLWTYCFDDGLRCWAYFRCTFYPAVSFGFWAAGRFEGKNLFGYILAQLIGAIVAAGTLFLILSGKPGFETVGGFASNGYGALSPDGYSMTSVIIAEFVLTAFFLFIILGSTSKDAPSKFAPIAIGLGLTLIHLISIPISNTSVNPARSTSQALFAGGDYPAQLWLFWLAPIAGAIVAGLICKASKKCCE